MSIERNIDPIARKGLRIKLIKMADDPNPIEEGMEGTIVHIDDIGTLHIQWDDGRYFGVIPKIDKYILYPPKEDVIDDIDSLFSESSLTSIGKDKAVINKSMPKPTLRGANSTNAGSKVKSNFKSGFSKSKVRDIKVEDEEDVVKGGKADKHTTKSLAKKHGVSEKNIKKELEVGMDIELEHTDSKKLAREIAMDHIAEFPDYYTNKKHGTIASEKGLKKTHSDDDIEETTTAGAAGAFVGPLSGKKKNESRVIKFKDLINEISSTESSKLRTSGYDGKAWVGDKDKDGWHFDDVPAWEDGEIVDILSKLDINWKDEKLTLTNENFQQQLKNYLKESKKAYIMFTKDTQEGVAEVELGTENHVRTIDYLVDHGFDIKSISKEEYESYDKGDEVTVRETTTFSSVWGGDGPPVTPTFAAKKGKHKPSKKPMYKGGKIVQNVSSDDVLIKEEHGKNYSIDALYDVIKDELMKAELTNGDNAIEAFKKIMSSNIGGLSNFELPHHKEEYGNIDALQLSDDGETITGSLPHTFLALGIIPKLKDLKIIDTPKNRNDLAIVNKLAYLLYQDIRPTLSNDSDLGRDSFYDLDNLGEENKIKYVKGGKFVKIKDKCAKYRNQPWCDAGNASDPLQLSEKTKNNIKKISKKTGIKEEKIISLIKEKLKNN